MSTFMKSAYGGWKWEKATNVPTPTVFTDDFSSDRGYFVEENGASNRKIENGMLSISSRDDLALTYLHIYEPNVKVKARMRYKNANPPDAGFGILLRYNAINAYARAAFLLSSGLAFIDYCHGKEFFPAHDERASYRLMPDIWYDIEFTADGNVGELKINGESVLKIDSLDHVTPGRIAFFANRTDLDIDFTEITFLSGEGTLWKNAHHTMLPEEDLQGGSVLELNDGSLTFIHESGTTYVSDKDGRVWTPAERWQDQRGITNMLRLSNGDLLKIGNRTEADGTRYVACELSSNEGKTWRQGGHICYQMFRNITENVPGQPFARTCNMNDKLTQMSSGRIFYGQNYEGRFENKLVFCEFYYSDDNGMTWHKSETDSFDLGGKDKNNVTKFGECKILECADGSLRMYNSWNEGPCVVYSESFDGGVTWGELHEIPELVCGCSSMQFVKDVYADNETTYYMVLPFSPRMKVQPGMTRSRLSLFMSTDGKNWEFLGDCHRWEHKYNIFTTHFAHIVNPFIKVTKDYVICGSGFSEHQTYPFEKDGSHHQQRQHIWTIPKAMLKGKPIPKVRGISE